MELDAAAPPLTPPATTPPTDRRTPHASVSTPVPQQLHLSRARRKIFTLTTPSHQSIRLPTFGRSARPTFDPLLPIARVPGCRSPARTPLLEWRVPALALLSCEKRAPSSPPLPRKARPPLVSSPHLTLHLLSRGAPYEHAPAPS